jgi:glycerophosphoryl diester phosphodiesterase
LASSLTAFAMKDRPLVIAHRGASYRFPENTCPALAIAVDLGADMVEVDVQLSQDGQAVIFHDWNLARVARSTGYSHRQLKALSIYDLSLKELKQFDVGSWLNRKFAGLAIPTLSEVLVGTVGQISLNLELKMPRLGGEERRWRLLMVDQLKEAVTRYDASDSVLVSSFDAPVLELVRVQCPHWRLGVLPQPGGVADTVRVAERLKAFSVHLPSETIRPAVVTEIQQKGLRVFAYTADRTYLLRRLIATAVNGIFTNVPDRLRSLLDQP